MLPGCWETCCRRSVVRGSNRVLYSYLITATSNRRVCCHETSSGKTRICAVAPDATPPEASSTTSTNFEASTSSDARIFSSPHKRRPLQIREVRSGGGLVTSPRQGLLPPGVMDPVRDLYLPDGYPASVTCDYLEYQLWSLPTHVTVGGHSGMQPPFTYSHAYTCSCIRASSCMPWQELACSTC